MFSSASPMLESRVLSVVRIPAVCRVESFGSRSLIDFPLSLVEACLLTDLALQNHVVELDGEHETDDQAEDESRGQDETQEQVHFVAVLDAPVHF